MEKNIESNVLKLTGKVITDPVFSHEVLDEKFYEFKLEVKRLSEAVDTLNCVISEKILDEIAAGVYVTIDGQIRTTNKVVDGKTTLNVSAFVRNIKTITDEEAANIKNPNEVTLIAYICKEPKYRETPNGREISDALLAVNRKYRKCDYIPAIAWGRNAVFASKLHVGDKIEVVGRFQSRDYNKKTVVDGVETSTAKTAYEVSISRMALAPADEE